MHYNIQITTLEAWVNDLNTKAWNFRKLLWRPEIQLFIQTFLKQSDSSYKNFDPFPLLGM